MEWSEKGRRNGGGTDKTGERIDKMKREREKKKKKARLRIKGGPKKHAVFFVEKHEKKNVDILNISTILYIVINDD